MLSITAVFFLLLCHGLFGMEGVPMDQDFIESLNLEDLDILALSWANLDHELRVDHLKAGLEFSVDKGLVSALKWLLEREETSTIDISALIVSETKGSAKIRSKLAKYAAVETDFYSHCQNNDFLLIDGDLVHPYFKASYYEKGFALAVENKNAASVFVLLDSPLKALLSQKVLSKSLADAVGSGCSQLIKNIIRQTDVDISTNEYCALRWAVDKKEHFLLEQLLDRINDLSSVAGTIASDHLHNANGYTALTLLSDPRFDPGVNDNVAILQAFKAGNTQVLSMLLAHPMVDPFKLFDVFEDDQPHHNLAIAKAMTLLMLLDPLLWAARTGDLVAFEAINFRGRNKEALGTLLLAACMGGHEAIVKLISPHLEECSVPQSRMVLTLCFNQVNVAKLLFDMNEECRNHTMNLYKLNGIIKKANRWHAGASLEFLFERLVDTQPILHLLWNQLKASKSPNHYIDLTFAYANSEFREYPSIQALINHTLSSFLFEYHLSSNKILPHEIGDHILAFIRPNYGY